MNDDSSAAVEFGAVGCEVAAPIPVPVLVPSQEVLQAGEIVPLAPTNPDVLRSSHKNPLKRNLEHWQQIMTVPQATALLVVVVALTGITFPLVKFVAGAFDSTTILAGRFIVASLFLLPWMEFSKKLMVAGLETGAWLTIGNLAQAVCLAGGTSAGVASFFASLSCVVCPFLEARSGVRLTARSWIAAALATAGTACLCLGGGALPTAGDLIGLSQPILFGIFLFRTELVMRVNPGKAMEITALQVAVVSVCSVAWGLLGAASSGLAPIAQWGGMCSAGLAYCSAHMPQFLGLVGMGVFSSAFVLVAQTIVVTKLSSSKTSLMFAAEPLFAAAVACALLGESVGLSMVVGGTLAIGACVVSSSDRAYSKLSSSFAALIRLLRSRPRQISGKNAA